MAIALDDELLDKLFDKIGDYLSDEYGYCISGYNLEIKATDIEWDTKE